MRKYINGNLKSPNLFLFFALVSSAIVLMLVGIYTYHVLEAVLENSVHSRKIRHRVENIRFFDEVLTSSTLLAASTGDAQWEKRYLLFEPKLDSAINELLLMDPSHAIHQTLKMTDSANIQLIAMEHRVFELVHLERRNEAYEIVTGSEYARQKAMYSEGISTFIKQHELKTDQLQTRLQNAANRSKWFFGLVMMFLVIVWLPIERFIHRNRAQMLQQNQELELQIQARKESESALQESKKQIEKTQEQLQESIKASSIGLWEWNMQTNQVYLSPEFKKQIGYKDDEVQNSSEFYFSHLHAEDAIIVNEAKPKLLDGAIDKLELEYRFRHKDGTYRWMLARTSLQRDQNGKPLRMFGSHIDITERKLAEEALKKSELRFKQISENSQEWIWEHDCNGLYTYVSPVCKELLGYEAEEITGIKYFYDSFDPGNKEEMKKAAFEAIARKESFRNFINCNIHKDGRKVILSTSGVPILDKENNLIGYRGVDVDITERILAEELLRQSEIELQVVIESTADGILAIDGNGKVIKTNNRFAELWKIPSAILNSGDDATLLNFVLEQLVNPKQFLDKVQQLYNSMDEDSDTLFFKDGRIFERYSAPLLLDDKIIGRVWSFRDITGRKHAEEALKESEEKYRILAESSPEMIYLIDTKGYVTYVNKVAAAQFRAPAQELIGKLLKDIFPPDLAQQNLTNIQNVIATKNKYQSEVEMVFPTGNRWIDARLTPVFDDKDQVTGVLGLSYDITDRKQAEETLRESEQRFRHLFEVSPEAIMLIDPFDTNVDWPIVDCNETACKMNGYAREELIGKSIDIVNISSGTPEERAGYLEELRHNGIMHLESFHRHRKGHIFPIEVSTSIVTFLGREIILGIDRDITDRKQAEEALRASQQLIEGIINAISVRVFWKDKNLIYLGCNKIFARDAGFSDPKDVIGKDDFQMGWLDQAELYRLGDRQVMESGCPIILKEEPQTTPEGNTIILLTNKIPLQDSMGEIIGILGTSIDITDRKRTEDEIKLKNEELQKLNAEKDKFFSIIAHDLRSPFSSFLGLTQIMAEELPSLTMAQVQDLAISMEHSATNLYSLLENLLQWARMQQGLISFNPEEIQLHKIAAESIASMMEPAKNKGINLVYDISTDIKVVADSNMLQTVIRNLISNAVKFTNKGGEISLLAKTNGESKVEISIRDTGIGMNKDLLDKLFRIDEHTSRPGTNGEPSTGLGLLLCKEFIEKLGGKIWVESEEGKGSDFKFTIPTGGI